MPQADCLETLAAIMTNSSHPGKHPALPNLYLRDLNDLSRGGLEPNSAPPTARRAPIDVQPLQLRHLEEAPGDDDVLMRGGYGGGRGGVSSGVSGAIVMSMGDVHS